MADEIPTEALEAAARALFDHDRVEVGGDPPWEQLGDDDRDSYRRAARSMLAAAAPYLIAEGRRQAAAEIRGAAVDGRLRAEVEESTTTRTVLLIKTEALADVAEWIAEGNHE